MILGCIQHPRSEVYTMDNTTAIGARNIIRAALAAFVDLQAQRLGLALTTQANFCVVRKSA